MAASPFFITGLPRSRTAWMSVAASGRNSICYHEPGEGDFASAAEVWSAPDLRKVGISDAGLGMHINRILEEIKPKTLIIERDAEEVLRSYATYAKCDLDALRPVVADQMAALQAALSLANSPLIRRVRFEELSDIEVVKDCLTWLGVKPRMLDQLMRLNIQSDFGFNVARVQAMAAAA